MKKYENPMLSFVSIKNDIVTESTIIGIGESGSANDAETAGRRFDDWYEGF